MEFGNYGSSFGLAHLIPQTGLYPLPYALRSDGYASSRHGDDYSSASTPLDDSVGPWSGMDFLGKAPKHHSEADPLGDFFSGKKAFLSDSIEGVVGLIYERQHLKYENFRKIDYDSCRAKTLLFQIDQWRLGLHQNVDRLRMGLEKELIGLERERRMEEVACWRDIVRLKTDLRELTGEFAQEKRRDSLLSDGK